MVWPAVIGAAGAIGAAGISSAASLLGARGPSERDLMWNQAEVSEYLWEKSLKEGPRREVAGLRAAGVNPMLPYVRGDAGPTALSVSPGVAAPVNKYAGAGEALERGVNSAVNAVLKANEIEKIKADTEVAEEMPRRVRAETERIASETALNTARAATEFEQPGLVVSSRELNSAKTELERQKLQREIVETAIARQDLTVAEKDAVIAAIDIDMYSSTVGEVSRWLEKLGVSPRAAVGMAHSLWNLFRQKSRRR